MLARRGSVPPIPLWTADQAPVALSQREWRLQPVQKQSIPTAASAAAKRILDLERRVEELEVKMKRVVRAEAKRRQRHARNVREAQRVWDVEDLEPDSSPSPNGSGD